MDVLDRFENVFEFLVKRMMRSARRVALLILVERDSEAKKEQTDRERFHVLCRSLIAFFLITEHDWKQRGKEIELIMVFDVALSASSKRITVMISDRSDQDTLSILLTPRR